MTYHTLIVLNAFLREGKLSGSEITKFKRLGRRGVYPILHRLESHGILKGCWEEGDTYKGYNRPPKLFYQLTEEGENYAREVLSEFDSSLLRR